MNVNGTEKSAGGEKSPAADPSGDKRAECPATRARRVMRAADRAALATAMRPDAGTDIAMRPDAGTDIAMRPDAGTDLARPDAGAANAGWPCPSLVMTALDHDATPLLLISTLADHTRNIVEDNRVGLLFDGTVGMDQPLTGARVSVLGRAIRSDEPRHRERYLARHPDAALFAGFADFAIYRIVLDRAHLVAGFGKIHWIGAGALMLDTEGCGLLADAEADIVAHMNRDHADALDLYAGALLSRSGSGWRLTGIDPEGCDLRHGGSVARLEFDRLVRDAEGARAELVRLVRKARRAARDGGDRSRGGAS